MKINGREVTEEELNKVYAMLGLKAVKTSPIEPIDYKVIKAITTCSLCKTVTVQYFQMAKTKEGQWIKDKEISEEDYITYEPNKFERFSTRSRLCYNCKPVLMLKTKEELISMILVSKM